jgi:hypothetical protein
MDMFQGSAPQADPTVLVKTYDKLNDKILVCKDSNRYGCIMLSKTDSKLIVLHCLSFYSAPLGVANEPWHQKLFALTGDNVGNQVPQTAHVPSRALDLLA